jgi:hypothetical protein
MLALFDRRRRRRRLLFCDSHRKKLTQLRDQIFTLVPPE